MIASCTIYFVKFGPVRTPKHVAGAQTSCALCACVPQHVGHMFLSCASSDLKMKSFADDRNVIFGSHNSLWTSLKSKWRWFFQKWRAVLELEPSILTQHHSLFSVCLRNSVYPTCFLLSGHVSGRIIVSSFCILIINPGHTWAKYRWSFKGSIMFINV